MHCPQCHHQNTDSAKFCEKCGARLITACPQCGHTISPTAKFCAECGAALSGKSKVKSQRAKIKKPQHPTPNTQPLIPNSQFPTGERRQLTVMFCDLVGSTALSAHLDPEELREVIGEYQQTCAAVIQRYEGHIAQYLGDGLLVYFGYPTAHEDDAQRTVRAGLEIVEGFQSRAREQAAIVTLPYGRGSDSLSVRIGIHTGPVVVSEIGRGNRREQLALGETPNVAARIQGVAVPNTVVLSAATYRLELIGRWGALCSGELIVARAHFKQSLALYNFQEHRTLAFVYGHDPGMSSLCFAAVALWHLGYPEQALKSSQAAVSLAREVTHPFSLTYALDLATLCHQLRREGQRTKEQAEAVITLSTEHGVPLFLAQCTIFRGWALAEQGQEVEGLAQMNQGLVACQATGAEIWQPYFLALLAETYGKVGQAEKGLGAVSEALEPVHSTGERYYEAELYRLKGELLLAQAGKGQK